jgi:hypothetical protein
MQNSIKSLATGALFSAIASVSHADKLVYDPQAIDISSPEVKALCVKANKKV